MIGAIAAHYLATAEDYMSAVLADSPWMFLPQVETAGSTLADASPNNHDAAITGAPTFNQPAPDAALPAISWPSSAGATEHYAKSIDTVGTSAGTCEALVFVPATPAARTPILCSAASYGSGVMNRILFVNTDGRIGFFVYSGGGSFAYSAAPVALNTWLHVVGSVGPAGQKLRINKATVGTGAKTASETIAMHVFVHGGGQGAAPDIYTNGDAISIAAPAFYTTQLSDTRTDAHFDALGQQSAYPSASLFPSPTLYPEASA